MVVGILCITCILLLAIMIYYMKKYFKLIKFLSGNNVEAVIKDEIISEIVPKHAIIIIKNISHFFHDEYSSEMLNKQMQYSALQSQINPHFLYNTLESIRGEALMCDNYNIANMTEKLSRFFRYCISSKGDFVTIREEIANVKDYFYIQRYRFDEKFELEIDVKEIYMEYYIPKLSLQPIIENAIYHGLENLKEGGKVNISIIPTEKNIRIIISDNGIGIKENELIKIREKLCNMECNGNLKEMKKTLGIALYNVNSRIKLCFGTEYGVLIRSTFGMGTDVEVMIPKIISIKQKDDNNERNT